MSDHEKTNGMQCMFKDRRRDLSIRSNSIVEIAFVTEGSLSDF